jgi:hypothetical protein
MAEGKDELRSTAAGTDAVVTTDDATDMSRRKLGRLALYTAPAMVALLTSAQAQKASGVVPAPVGD